MCSKNNVIRSIIKSSCLFVAIIFAIPQHALADFKLKTIVLDAGHGGHDGGCTGHSGHSHEKDVVLSIVLKAGKLIEQKYPDVNVVYTRKTDVFIPLEQRAETANKNKADLFISVHCNANANTSAYGSETYLMGLHKTEANLEVAARENAVIKLEKDYKKTYDGFDPDSPASMIALSLAQNANIEQSSYIAGRIQNYFANSLGRYNRGVKQAGFWVLYRTTSPSILIETGFLTNAAEEKYLTSEKGQNEIAETILKAFTDYKKYIEKDYLSASNNTTTTKPENITPEPSKIEQPSASVDSNNEAKNQVDNQITTKGIVYKIQLAAVPSIYPSNHKIYKSGYNIKYEKYGSLYKYVSGPFDNFKKAIEEQNKIRNNGYKDAFIVVYKDGERLSFSDAKQFLK